MTTCQKHIIKSCVIRGADALGLDIEASLADRWAMLDLPSAAACAESLIRLRSALRVIGVQSSSAVRFAARLPAPPTAGALDLALTTAALVALGEIPAATLDGLLVLGEVGLDGSVRATRGVLSAALLARASGLRGVLVPASCAWEAAMVPGIEVHAADDLAGVVAVLRGERVELRFAAAPVGREAPSPDMSEVRCQGAAIAATARLVARGRGVLFVGPPGTGKTMIARRVSTLLPELTPAESIEVTRVHSVIGMALRAVDRRPFRAPHHTISTAALCGGAGPTLRLGELQLATRGVLFLDELTEFRASTIASLGDALRRMTAVERPLVVASANPCPCGWWDSDVRACRCSAEAVSRHQAHTRTLAAMLGIVVPEDGRAAPEGQENDLVRVEAVSLSEIHQSPPGESSARIRSRLWAREADQDEVIL